MLVHKDNRRSLFEFKYPVTKVLCVHSDCILGNHYHKERDETFMLVSGESIAYIGDKTFPMELCKEIEVKREIRHSFEVKANSTLLEFATKEYDPKDDYKD